MIDFSYLERGWTALAKAHPAGSMAGHLGAGVLAGYYFGELNPDLDPAVFGFVTADLDRIIDGEEAIWFNPKKSGITITEMFTAQGADDPPLSAAEASSQIAAELVGTMDSLRQSGHNVIFGSLALRALADHPDLATQSTVDGVVRLMKQFRGARPGRGNYGKEEGWKMGETVDISEVAIPDYDTLVETAEVTIDELIHTAHFRTQGYGGLFHLLDHAAALIECWEHGFPELAFAGIPAHREHVKYLRTLPDLEAELGPLEKSSLYPTDPEYWARQESAQWSAWLTHRIKSLYGFSVVSAMIEDEEKVRKAKDALRFMMA